MISATYPHGIPGLNLSTDILSPPDLCNLKFTFFPLIRQFGPEVLTRFIFSQMLTCWLFPAFSFSFTVNLFFIGNYHAVLLYQFSAHIQCGNMQSQM